jgi:hypothetical protein
MWRWIEPTCILALCLLALGGSVRDARADDVEAYLEAHDLPALLAIHLEELLTGGDEAERQRILTRLVGLYAQLLETETDQAAREALEQRARKLLTQAPDAVADELRLALLRGSYRGIERTAEEHRLRLRSEAEVAAARAQLDEISGKLMDVRKRLRETVETTERRLARASGVDAVLLAAQADRQRQLATQADFLTGWSLYYTAWLDQRKEPAAAAESIFAEVLDIADGRAEPQEVSVDLRAREPYARAILGMAMVKCILASPATTSDWLDLLEHENTHAAIREQLPAWRMVNFLEHHDYAAAATLLQSLQRGGRDVPIPWIRLLAVHALEAHPSDTAARSLAEEALALLAARGELGQVLDLASRYGAERLGEQGFAMRYVRGVQRYDQARQRHSAEEPATDPEAVSLYKAAAEELLAALRQEDMSRFPEAASSARMLIGRCRYFASDFKGAKDAFIGAAGAARSEQGAEALWMAIVSLDRLGSEGSADELNGLIDRFLEQFPADSRAVQLLIRRAASRPAADVADVDRLLAVEPGDERYLHARRTAAALLFQLWRQGGPDAVEQRRRFLEVAGEVVDASNGLEAEACASLLLGRQLLDAAAGGADASQASEMEKRLAQLRALLASCPESATIEPELAYREVQLRLIRGDLTGAHAAASALLAQAGVWADAATIALFNEAVARRAAGARADAEAQKIVIELGTAILERHDRMRLDEAALRSCRAAVAEACFDAWEQGEEARGRQALDAFKELLAVQQVGAWLRSAAILAEAFDEPQQAADWWRMLASGVESGSQPWWEARTRLMLLLAQIDARRAREVLDQHLQLHPEYGPEPWGPMLRELDERLGGSSSGS